MRYKEVTFPDRPSWLAWRHEGIGSSDASVIMGVSRFKQYQELLKEKALPFSGEDQANSYIKERGNKIEISVRKYLEEKYGTTLNSFNCESLSFPFLRASIDGGSPDRKLIVEIKLLSTGKPGSINKEAEGYKKWLAAKEKNEVPAEYFPQIEHQLMITGAKKCLFVGYREEKGNYSVTEDKLAIVEVTGNSNGQFKHLCNFWFNVDEYKKELEYKGELE